jgi:hypothetical protein
MNWKKEHISPDSIFRDNTNIPFLLTKHALAHSAAYNSGFWRCVQIASKFLTAF